MGTPPISPVRLAALHPEVRLEFSSTSTLTSPAYASELLTHWSITGHVVADDDDGFLTATGTGEVTDDGTWEAPVFEMYGVTVPLGDGINHTPALDAESADLGELACVLDGDDLDDALTAFGSFLTGSDLVLIDSAHLAPLWRGHGIGRLLIARGLQHHLTGARCIATIPCPVELLEEYGDDRQQPVFVAALAAVQRTWASIGFELFTGEVWVMDPGTLAGADHVDRLHRKILGGPR